MLSVSLRTFQLPQQWTAQNRPRNQPPPLPNEHFRLTATFLFQTHLSSLTLHTHGHKQLNWYTLVCHCGAAAPPTIQFRTNRTQRMQRVFLVTKKIGTDLNRDTDEWALRTPNLAQMSGTSMETKHKQVHKEYVGRGLGRKKKRDAQIGRDD